MKRMALSLAIVLVLSGTACAWTEQYNNMWLAFTIASDQVARSGYADVAAKEFAQNAGQLINEHARKGNITENEVSRLRCQVMGLSLWLADGGYQKDMDLCLYAIKRCIETGAMKAGR
jgi:hypothetical protein